jgi:hypothetical protein
MQRQIRWAKRVTLLLIVVSGTLFLGENARASDPPSCAPELRKLGKC